MGQDFTPEQKRYLEGFASGLNAGRAAGTAPAPPPRPSGPDRGHLEAAARVEAQGKKLADQEKWKREEHPFDAYARLRAQSRRNEYPKPPDNFRWRYYGLFYVAPNQPFYMARLRIPNGSVTHWQLAGLADVAEKFGGGYMHATTRANLQIREIEARNATNVLEAVQDLGLTSRGAGADNIRNVTGDATAGLAAQELVDTRPHAREWHFHVLNDRSLNGLPRKFNVAFDGGGPIPTLEETNDIGFQAIEVESDAGAPAGVCWRLLLGGVTGHRDLARDTGVIVPLDEATAVADAIVRVFIERGDRTNRAKARLKYVLDAMGFDGFLAAVEQKLGARLMRVDPASVKPRPAQDRMAHVGVHKQKQSGVNYVGVALPVGRLTATQARALAQAASAFGDGDIRLTVWQNLLISGVPDAAVASLDQALRDAGLAIASSPVRTGLVACTGAAGCRFANAHTKEIAEQIAQWCERRAPMESAINIHVTGCPNSCAQHYIGDIGLVGARVPVGDDGDAAEGFHIVIGGGYGDRARIARDYLRDVKAQDAPAQIERILHAYLRHRSDMESFVDFAARHSVDDLLSFAQEIVL